MIQILMLEILKITLAPYRIFLDKPSVWNYQKGLSIDMGLIRFIRDRTVRR